jgi:hypothetical protein
MQGNSNSAPPRSWLFSFFMPLRPVSLLRRKVAKQKPCRRSLVDPGSIHLVNLEFQGFHQRGRGLRNTALPVAFAKAGDRCRAN